MRKRSRWSEFELQQVINKIRMGVTISRIAKDHSVSRTAIYQLLERRRIDIDAIRSEASA